MRSFDKVRTMLSAGASASTFVSAGAYASADKKGLSLWTAAFATFCGTDYISLTVLVPKLPLQC